LIWRVGERGGRRELEEGGVRREERGERREE
jgi:hypothetical protein